jgi:hypothetical protein
MLLIGTPEFKMLWVSEMIDEYFFSKILLEYLGTRCNVMKYKCYKRRAKEVL